MKRIVALVLCFCVLCLAGCKDTAPVMQVYSCGQLEITLPNDFAAMGQMQTEESFFYGSDGVYISGFREDRQELESIFGPMDLQTFAEKTAELNKLDAQVTQRDGIPTFTYHTDIEGSGYTFCCIAVQTDDGFWRVQAGCAADRYDQMKATLWQYLCSVTPVK